ncbi:hypothetical protein M23134_01949 [Microscilla marina ATCC 23134]|uniref:Uncharacterized protein n=1 Tax=Microscilla marina ATCC 23134 TaxID=313606 RepID=A1ZCB8_MICM2|nr:hypothetical protein M23134_01949 [Microscilla marina ATCC 23134]
MAINNKSLKFLEQNLTIYQHIFHPIFMYLLVIHNNLLIHKHNAGK